MRRYIWWPRLAADVEEYVGNCPICNAIKAVRAPRKALGRLDKSTVFRMVSLDHVGPRTIYGRKWWVLVMIDHHSRYLVTVSTETPSTENTKQCFREHWVAKFGAPECILTDRGSVFTGKVFRQFIDEELNCYHIFASLEYPQGNGINESVHRALETAIQTTDTGPHPRWDFSAAVDFATLLHNVTPHPCLGETPAMVMFGCDLHVPGLKAFEEEPDEDVRQQRRLEHRGFLALKQAMDDFEKESLKDKRDEKKSLQDIELGAIVTYKLAESERKERPHHTGNRSYEMVRSFPHRVVGVTDTNLLVRPLWTEGQTRKVPRSEVRLLTRTPEGILVDEAKQLYPQAEGARKRRARGSELSLHKVGPGPEMGAEDDLSEIEKFAQDKGAGNSSEKTQEEPSDTSLPPLKKLRTPGEE